MFEKVGTHPDLVSGEHQILQFWEESGAFDALRKQNKGGPKWSFLDGPITANNPMGVHHAWGRTYKDAFQRYFAMRGFDQRWQNGFDCQGLWVEVEVEREKGFKSKKDIEAFGVENFIEACKERVLHFADVITEQSVRLGMWMDWENSYFTMSDENNYTIWSFLKKCHSRNFIYKGLDSMPWCPRCGTGMSEQERREGYEEVEDESVFVRFPLRERKGESLLVWTTTPWTLAANVAAAVHPELTYVRVPQGDGSVWVAESLRASVSEDAGVEESIKGEAMVGWTYDGPFDELPGAAAAVDIHRIIPWDEVADDEGTGIVHIATGCGKEDFQLGKQLDLPVIAPIDAEGNYYEGFGFLTGRNASKVADAVYESLQDKGLFFKQERYTHDYPHCWRCDTPLLFRAVDEWYIDMSWRDEIAEVVGQIRWIPDFGRDQELDWLKNMSDWMISKKRYWGLALPIWECSSCDWFDVIGSKEELQERAVDGWDEFEGNTPHRPWIDAVKIRCEECGDVASRIPEVGNVWLDAGVVPYSTVGYNTDRERWAEWIPADFVTESFPGQFRNWFYALLAMSTMLEGIEPFKNLLGYALVRDEHGEEMHASKGNAIEFNEAADRVSADVMRWVYCRATPTNNLSFGYEILEQTSRKVFGTLWNVFGFFSNYAILDRFDPKAPKIAVAERPEIDRWILSRLHGLTALAHERWEDYWIFPFVREAEAFIEDLSNWYVRRSRPRFWSKRGENEHDKQSAYQTLYEVLTTLTGLIAPVTPFLSERMYRSLVAGIDEGAPMSVHLTSYPEADDAVRDSQLDAQMDLVKELVGAAHSLRKASGHRVRQPLRVLRVAGGSSEAIERLSHHILEELNVKEVEVVDNLDDISKVSASPDFSKLGPKFGKEAKQIAASISELGERDARALEAGTSISVSGPSGDTEITPTDVKIKVETSQGWVVGQAGKAAGHALVALDITLTPELEREGIARDFVRHIQSQRKELDLNIEDRIRITYQAASDLGRAIEEWADYIRTETQSDELVEGNVLDGAEATIAGEAVRFQITRS